MKTARFVLSVFSARKWTRNVLPEIFCDLAMVYAIFVLFYFVTYSISVIKPHLRSCQYRKSVSKKKSRIIKLIFNVTTWRKEGWRKTLFWSADTVNKMSPNEKSELPGGEVPTIRGLGEIDF